MTRLRRVILQILLLPVLPVLAKGPKPDDFNKPTEAEKAGSEVAANMFNLYLEGKPVTEAYRDDISKDPSITANAVQGEAAADLAAKTPVVTNPNQNVNPTGMAKLAGKRSKIMNDLSQDSVAQKSAGMKTYVENALGVQSSANTAQTGMAADAVERNITKAESDYETKTAGVGAVASLAGAGASLALKK